MLSTVWKTTKLYLKYLHNTVQHLKHTSNLTLKSTNSTIITLNYTFLLIFGTIPLLIILANLDCLFIYLTAKTASNYSIGHQQNVKY